MYVQVVSDWNACSKMAHIDILFVGNMSSEDVLMECIEANDLERFRECASVRPKWTMEHLCAMQSRPELLMEMIHLNLKEDFVVWSILTLITEAGYPSGHADHVLHCLRLGLQFNERSVALCVMRRDLGAIDALLEYEPELSDPVINLACSSDAFEVIELVIRRGFTPLNCAEQFVSSLMATRKWEWIDKIHRISPFDDESCWTFACEASNQLIPDADVLDWFRRHLDFDDSRYLDYAFVVASHGHRPLIHWLRYRKLKENETLALFRCLVVTSNVMGLRALFKVVRLDWMSRLDGVCILEDVIELDRRLVENRLHPAFSMELGSSKSQGIDPLMKEWIKQSTRKWVPSEAASVPLGMSRECMDAILVISEW